MDMTKLTSRLATACFLIFAASACVSTPAPQVAEEPASSEVNETTDMVSIDLVNALMQVDELHPAVKSLEMQIPDSDFGRSLRKVLSLAGYQINTTLSGARDSLEYSASRNSSGSAAGSTWTYQLGVDSVKIKRDYSVENGRVLPASSLYVQGTDPSAIQLNDYIFATGVDLNPVNVSAREPEQVAIQQTTVINDTGVVTTPIDRPAVSVAPQTPLQSDNWKDDNSRQASISQSQSENNVSVRQKRNLYELGESNFVELFGNYRDVESDILVFGNDDFRFLGRPNKIRINEMVDKFVRSTDIFSVIGCSHGSSNLTGSDDPNAVLALGRAGRVKEELLLAGVPENKILDEGCWAVNDYDDVMPRRGVVISLKRKKT